MSEIKSPETRQEEDKIEPFLRQQAAIVYADVANYSGLCAHDEDGTHRLLEQYLDVFAELVAEHSGQVHHYAGDAVLATFETAQSAVVCAIAIQTKLVELNEPLSTGRRVEFRIGINEGTVIPTRGDVYGDDVNIAARLEALSVPGAVCISEAVKLAIDEKELGVTLIYLGERRLKNLQKRIAAYQIDLGNELNETPSRLRSRTGAWLQLPSRPSLAVLPFECVDDDPTVASFADGLSMEVMTELVKLSGLFLASDFSTLSYRGENPSPEAVLRELGVRYLLQGKVRLSGDRIRVYAQLIDTKSGNRLWAERYENGFDDLFEIQDSITESIIMALDIKLVSGERSRVARQSIKNREALHHYYAGWSHLIAGAREDLIMARREFEIAADLEPDSPMPLAMASWTYWWLGFRILATDPVKAIEKAEHFANRARSIDDPSGFSSLVMAQVHLSRREHDLALEAARFALELRPSCDVSAATFASVLNYLDRSEEAIPYAEQAIRLTPIAPTIYPEILASSYFWAGRYEEAIFAAQMVIQHNIDSLDAWLVLAIAESAAGNTPASRAAMEEVLSLRPDLQLNTYLETQPYIGKARLEELEGHLRVAGLQ